MNSCHRKAGVAIPISDHIDKDLMLIQGSIREEDVHLTVEH